MKRKLIHHRLSKQKKYMRYTATGFIFLIITAFLSNISSLFAKADEPLIWPTPLPTPSVVSKINTSGLLATPSLPSSLEGVGNPTPIPLDDMELSDIYVGKYVDLFMAEATPGKRSEARAIMHCLLSIESAHNENKGKGDGGLASGPLQYHKEAYFRMRSWMMAEGYADSLGNRDNLEDAISTTVWILWQSRLPYTQRKGSISEWGPIYRVLRHENRQTCKLPSWYHN